MAMSHNEKSGIVWSLLSWGAAIVIAIVVGWIATRIFGGVSAGLAFGGIVFMVAGWTLNQRLGPREDDAAHDHGHHHAAPVAAAAAVAMEPVAAPVAGTVTMPDVVLATPVHLPEEPAAPEAGPEAGVVSQRVRDAARAAGEAARAAAGGAAPASGAVRPQFLAAPLEGGPDDLGRLKGVGPKLAEMLHANGIYHFSQIAAWGPEEIAWIETHMTGFSGRVERDDWVGQARTLAAGGETEHSQRVDRGEST